MANFIRFQSFLLEPFMPSCSAKINFMLGLEDRTEHDEHLGKHINDNIQNFKDIFLELTAKSKGIKQPILLFNKLTEQQIE